MDPTHTPIIGSAAPNANDLVSSIFGKFMPSVTPTVWPSVYIEVNQPSDFMKITFALEQCVGDQFETYLALFKEEQVTDKIVRFCRMMIGTS